MIEHRREVENGTVTLRERFLCRIEEKTAPFAETEGVVIGGIGEVVFNLRERAMGCEGIRPPATEVRGVEQVVVLHRIFCISHPSLSLLILVARTEERGRRREITASFRVQFSVWLIRFGYILSSDKILIWFG